MTHVHLRAIRTPKNAYQMRQLGSRSVRFDPLRFVHARMCSLDRFSINRHSSSIVSIIIDVFTAIKSFILREFTTIFENIGKFVPIWIENVSNWHVIAIRHLSTHNIWHTFIYEWIESKKCILDVSIRFPDSLDWSIRVRSCTYVFV